MSNPLFNYIAQLNQKNRYYLLGGLLVVIFLVDYLLILKNQLANISNLSPKINILRQDIKEAEENIGKIKSYESQIYHLKEQLESFDIVIPVKEEMPLVLEGISRIASQNKIKIEQMMPLKGQQEQILANKEGKFFAVSILVEAIGGYHDIGRFLDQLEKDSIFKSILALNITPRSEDPLKNLIRLTIKTIILEKAEENGQEGKGH